jgi:hypothetical protein
VDEVDEVVLKVQAGLNWEQSIVSTIWKSPANRSGAAAAAGPAANASTTAATLPATTERDMSDLLEAERESKADPTGRSYGRAVTSARNPVPMSASTVRHIWTLLPWRVLRSLGP